ncbi:MAG: hypothetical protein M0Z41_06545 [Peptococcaceae bacterium]|jgi:hypothetical protein|nr:hypothetical protein [Peptococcaceae bacterium]
MAKKKKHTSIPRCKRLNRKARLAAAKDWMAKYDGKRLVKAYRKHFAVDMLCALNELQMLGVEFTPEYVAQVKRNVEDQIKAKQERKRKRKEQAEINLFPDSDWYFAFIAGYTEGGFPYGITWEEARAMNWPGLDDQAEARFHESEILRHFME